MNVETKVQYSKEDLQCEISAEMRVGTMETLDANVEAMERDLAEILRLSGGLIPVSFVIGKKYITNFEKSKVLIVK